MPHPFVRLLVTVAIVAHFFIVGLAVVAHRGASYLQDDVLSVLAPYATIGNWRVDTNRLTIASASQQGEIVRVEWHRRNAPKEEWQAFPVIRGSVPGHTTGEMSRQERLDQIWLQQISGLLFFDNIEGVGQMLAGVMNGYNTQLDKPLDQVRVTVAPRLSIEQYLERKDAQGADSLPESLQPQVAFLASIVDLGDGQYSLLPQLKEHRASKTLLPSKPANLEGGKQP